MADIRASHPYRKKLAKGKWVTHVSADSKPEPGEWWSWIKHYRKLSGKTKIKCCVFKPQKLKGESIRACTNNGNANTGAHVLLGKSPKSKTQWIVPVCSRHNDGYGDFRTGDSMKVKSVYSVRARMGLTKNQQMYGKGTPKKSLKSNRKKKKSTKIKKIVKICIAVQDNGDICGSKLSHSYRKRCGKHQHYRFR